jgi:lysophospholipase L1-like esterase
MDPPERRSVGRSTFEAPAQRRGEGRGLPNGVGKTVRTLVVMVATLAVPYSTPRLRALRIMEDPWHPGSIADDAPQGNLPPAPPPVPGEQALPASENMATVTNALPIRAVDPRGDLPDLDPDVRASIRRMPIEDPTGRALATFFQRLARTDRREADAVTRILHYGDSTIASDYISGTVRRRLQARFGDSGHGFILIANPWQWYFHNDVVHGSSGSWSASRLAGPTAPDGMYGLGGVSFASYGGGVAWFGTTTRGDFGRKVSRFDLYYLEQPGGGTVELSVRGSPPERISTRGSEKIARVHSLHVPDGQADLAVRAVGGGPVRLFGVSLEREQPGVVYDALGAHAAMAVYWQRQNRAHWKQEMDLRDPALIIFQYGTNESDLWRLDRDVYERSLADLMDELHEIAPHASLLVVSPLDRAEMVGGKPVTKRVIVDLVSIQRRVASAHGAAFWDTFDAMGGPGSMTRWFETRPQLTGADLTHPTPLGAEVIGDMLSDALLAAYDRAAAH